MSELKVNSIKGVGASSAAITVNNTDGTCTGKITNYPKPNLIINGSMICAQRGGSSTASGYGSVDRWKISFGGTNEAITHAQVALSSSDTGPWEAGFRLALQLTNGNQTGGAGAADFIEVDQEIEAQNVVQSGWNTKSTSSYVTLSFWVKSSISQNFYGYLRTNDNTKQLYCFETGSLSANTWTKVTKTIPGASALDINNDTGAGVLLRLLPFYGTDMTGTRPLNAWAAYDSAARTPDSTATWYTTNDSTFALTGVALTVSEVELDYPFVSYADELARCQRYFQQWTGENCGNFAGRWNGASDFVYAIPVARPLRASPSVECKANDTSGSGNGEWKVFREDGASTCTNVPTVRSWTANTPQILMNLDGLSSGTDDRVGSIQATLSASGFLRLSAEL